MTLDVVFVPGFLCDERLFAHQVAALGDVPMIGSVTVADITRETSIEAMADAVLTQAPERFAVVGLSLGGIVATEVSHRAPQSLAGIAVLDTNLGEPDGSQLEQRRRWDARVRDGELLDVVMDDLVEPLTHDIARHRALIVDMALRAGAETFLRQNEALLRRRDRRDELAASAAPVLIACGREDELCPPHIHHDLAARTPHADLVVVEAAGHLATIDQPDALTRVLRTWLTRCGTRGRTSDSTHPNQPTHTTPTGGDTHEYTTA